MIRIVHILDCLRRGGKERQFIELLRGIDKTKFQIHSIILEKRTDGYDEEVKHLSYKFNYMTRKFRWDLFLILELAKYCKKEKIDIIYAWEGMTAFYGYAVSLFSSTKFINGSIRDTDNRKSYRRFIQIIILMLSKYVVANSIAGLKAYGVENKGKVIYNGLDLNRFNNLQKIENKKFVIGIVANLTEYKDYYTFFNAIKILSNKLNDFEVHIVGGGKLTETYKAYAEKIGITNYLIFFGRVKDVENYIINFDVGVLCSYKEKGEGLSNSILEYMASGIPPIITDIGAGREIIMDGISGFLFEAGNRVDLSEKILRLYTNKNLRLELGCNAKEMVFKKFEYTRYIKEMTEYYSEVLR